MSQFAFYFDSSRCTGCRTCEIACRDYKNLSEDIVYRRVYDYEGGSWTTNEDGTVSSDAFVYHLSLACNHCDAPACAHVCPTGAMHKDPNTGIVSVDEHKCIGCGYCHMACPYNAPTVDRSLGYSVKCNACAERLEENKNPICVDACPLRALAFGTPEEMEKLADSRGDVAPLPSPSLTYPNLYIKNNKDSRPAESYEGKVANILEVL
ncbi:MAG: 4Fe-4S binding protein [Coriobacteriia bacterium]|nr:4Fe-4S binding protein [Coriobacteriia bacterium]